MTYQLGFIGAGNMAEAIARGVVRSGLFRADQLIASDVAADRRQLFEQELKIRATESNVEIARQSATVMLCVKPQYMQPALENLGAAMDPSTLIISIAAGISSAFIARQLGDGKHWRIVRSMPNTPMLVGEGMVAIAPGANAGQQDLDAARRIFESAATVVQVAEDQIDAVTALSGSGPAYFFFLVEQMIASGVEMGLTAQQSHQLATRTALGAAKMLTTSHDSPAELRRKVTSPGGTTQAAVTHLEQNNVGPSIIGAIKAAQRHGKELGK
jgi:pyrroline-5-carboxylate reductase